MNCVIGARAGFAGEQRDHVSSTPQASGVTRPRPVTTTLRIAEATALTLSALRFVDVFDGVADGHDGFRRVVGDFDAEFFFERHDQLDRVEAVGAQIFDEGRVVGDLVGIDIQMLDDDLLHALGGIAHWS